MGHALKRRLKITDLVEIKIAELKSRSVYKYIDL